MTDEFIDMIAAETYTLIKAEQNDSEIKRLENLVAANQKSIDNLMQALMLGKATDAILAQIEKLETENKTLTNTIASEKALQVDYTYTDIRQWLRHFRELNYDNFQNRKALINTLLYRVIMYDNKIKILFHLKSGQKEALLMNYIFPDYPDGGTSAPANNANFLCVKGAYTPAVVETWGFEPHTSCMPCKRSTKWAMPPHHF